MEVDKRMKQEYTKAMSRKTLYVGLALAFVLSFIHIKYGLGLLVGLVVGQINYYFTANYVDNLFFEGRFVVSSFIVYAVVNYGLMILAFLLSVFLPSFVSIYMVALGLIMLKLVIYFVEIVLYKKGGSKK